MTALVRRPDLRGMKLVTIPSCSRKWSRKSPTGSCPTAVNNAERSPNRRVPTEMFVGQPPTYDAKLLISGKGEPMSFAYKSMELRPIGRISNFRSAINFLFLESRAARVGLVHARSRAPTRSQDRQKPPSNAHCPPVH